MSAEYEVIEDDERKFKDFFEKALQERRHSVKINKVELIPGCSNGENFVAQIIRVNISGHDQKLIDFRESFIVKKLPPKESPRYTFFNCSRLFQNEIAAYEIILPMFRRFAEKKIADNSEILCFPAYYGHSFDFIALEDLKISGYQMANRVQGFNLEECSSVLQKLSFFHAISFALKSSSPGSLLEASQNLEEGVMCSDYIDGINGVFWENSLKFAIESLKRSNDDVLILASQYFNKYIGSVLITLIDLIKPSEQSFNVICHGDLWSNNIMLRYDQQENPIDVKLLDLQAIRLSSCVLDVLHLIFTSTKPGLIQSHLNDLLRIYYEALLTNMKILDTELHFQFDDLVKEFKSKLLFGFFVAFIMFTCITKLPEDEQVVSDFSKENLMSDEVFNKIYLSLNLQYHERLHSLIRGLLHLGFLDLN